MGTNNTSSFDLYLRDIRLITHEENVLDTALRLRQLRAARRSRESNLSPAFAITPEEANLRETLILSQVDLVIRVAKSYRRCGLPLEDLVQEGNLGLITAVDRDDFDPARGHSFPAYVRAWVCKFIMLGIERNWTIKVPAKARADLKLLLGKVGSPAARDEDLGHLTAACGEDWTPHRTQRALDAAVTCFNYDPTITELEDSQRPNPDTDHRQRTEDEIAIADMTTHLHRLSPNQRRCVELRYGLNAEVMSPEAIAKATGMTRDRVRTLLREAMMIMKRKINDQSPELQHA